MGRNRNTEEATEPVEVMDLDQLLEQNDPGEKLKEALHVAGGNMIVTVQRDGPEVYLDPAGGIRRQVELGFCKSYQGEEFFDDPEGTLAGEFGGGVYRVKVKIDGKYRGHITYKIAGRPLPIRRGELDLAGEAAAPAAPRGGALGESLVVLDALAGIAAKLQPPAQPSGPAGSMKDLIASMREIRKLSEELNPDDGDDDDDGGPPAPQQPAQEDPLQALIKMAIEAFQKKPDVEQLALLRLHKYSNGQISAAELATEIKAFAAGSRKAKAVLSLLLKTDPKTLAGAIGDINDEAGKFYGSEAGLAKIAELQAALK